MAQVQAKDVRSKIVSDAKALLMSGPERAVEISGGEMIQWRVPKDRQVLDVIRLQALDMLEKLSKL